MSTLEDVTVPIRGHDVLYMPANSSFQLKVESVTRYCCSYVAE
ncbi:pyrimidine/purine nucleoside phosphorylase [Lysinibacillus sp. 3P01SB]